MHCSRCSSREASPGACGSSCGFCFRGSVGSVVDGPRAGGRSFDLLVRPGDDLGSTIAFSREESYTAWARPSAARDSPVPPDLAAVLGRAVGNRRLDPPEVLASRRANYLAMTFLAARGRLPPTASRAGWSRASCFVVVAVLPAGGDRLPRRRGRPTPRTSIPSGRRPETSCTGATRTPTRPR